MPKHVCEWIKQSLINRSSRLGFLLCKEILDLTLRFEMDGESATFNLEDIFGVYMHTSDAAAGYEMDPEMRHIQNLYIGPCGGFLVCATNDDLSARDITFANSPADAENRESYVIVRRPPNAPRDQRIHLFGVPLRLCAACSKKLEKSYKCSNCREVGVHSRYCSKACQVAHWPVHRVVCANLKLKKNDSV